MIRQLQRLIWAAVSLLMFAVCAQAQTGLSALAQLDPARTTITGNAERTQISIGLSQPIPFKAYLLDNPPRLVVDFRELDFGNANPKDFLGQGGVAALRWGPFQPGWSRLVAELPGPVTITQAVQLTQDQPQIRIDLATADPADFMPRAGAAHSALHNLPQPAQTDPSATRQDGSRPLRIVLDPGHGGLDPGAEAAGTSEAVLVLTFARDLKEALTRAGNEVVMTRSENVFVPLETRMTVARASGADLFLSLHADALESGIATGATVYLFDGNASDAASQKLAERHDRADLLAGVDLEGQGDRVAHVLMDLARAETQPRTVRLSQVMAGAIRSAGIKMHKHPVQGANFSVLRSPDIPSLLIELGFMSSKADRDRLLDADWRKQMAQAIVAGVQAWAQGDAAEARLLRQ
ncbi:N-acetylmuramoyl-L-alanine amidase [Thioclava sp. SK-1]|uniref:N-acetylmuramoyl-L-alanine amidase n=1 Tax=Thioclava sp. SK-1 TaxID=1889770 RepID=UPI0008250F9B|nr:N-acetylmuramoyl-L-alanine amidase [Thioclava sp. SK-1]OCX66081.1 N-acetylmuramoyl-L-alanine amidase [Thioclava sp. SK-1]